MKDDPIPFDSLTSVAPPPPYPWKTVVPSLLELPPPLQPPSKVLLPGCAPI